MKKGLASIISLLLVIIMSFGMLTACGDNGGSNGGGSGDGGSGDGGSGDGGSGGTSSVDKEGNTVVKIMFHVDKSSSEGQAYLKRVNAFNAAYKDQKIKAQAIFKASSAGESD